MVQIKKQHKTGTVRKNRNRTMQYVKIGSELQVVLTYMGTVFSLLSSLWHYNGYFILTHKNCAHPTRTAEKWRHSVATMNAINTKGQQLSP